MAKKPRQPRKAEIALSAIKKLKRELEDAMKHPLQLQAKLDSQLTHFIEELSPACKFVWEGIEYRIEDIQHIRHHDYEDCPYTPGYNSCWMKVVLPGRILITNKSSYDKPDAPDPLRTFERMIVDTFHVKLSVLCPIQDEYGGR